MKKAGIVERNTGDELIWYFDEAIKWRTAKINEQYLAFFPNCIFNKEKKIGNEDGVIQNPQELAKMFEALGLRIATEEEYLLLQKEKYAKQIPLWREELLSEREALKEVGIIERKIGDEIVWCFDEAKGTGNYPKIGGKNLMSFPNTGFNKAKGIGYKTGEIGNSQELAKMFEALGLRVRHPEMKAS